MIKVHLMMIYYCLKKDIYNRETNRAAFCVIHKMPIKPLPFYVTQIINNFLNSIISANPEKRRNFSQNGEIFKTLIVSLL